ncbi:MAG: Ig-like domain repeat protein [Acidimicrobiales bacterium]|nr:Ig-like domain repeat protein [Acidimicrobiales bacterium]
MATTLLISGTVLPAAAVTTVTTGGPFTYGEQDPPLNIGTGTTVAGGNFYDGQFVDFEITDATADETLALESVSTPVTTDGVVSVVGTAVYVGDGSSAVPIGSIDAVSDGAGGTKLRVNFGSDFRNAGFETGDVAPWTAVETMVELGVTSIAGFVTSDTATYPGNSGGDGDAPVSSSYSVSTTSSDPPGPTEGTYALGLTSSMTTANGCDVVHGPAAYSAPFDAVSGQSLSFDWRAFAGSDAYAVFGYLLNTASGAQTEVLDEYTTNASGTTDWATVNVSVPATGTYRFVFVSGTYDATCGRAAGASLYVDNFQVVSADLVDDAMVQSVARLLTYENASDDPDTVRTVTVTAQSVGEGSDSDTITVNITPENDPPVGDAISESWENNPGDDTFADITGSVSFTDPDDASLTYSIDGGTPGSFSIGGTDYEHQLVGTYGTLYVDEETGDYRIVADDAAIEAVSTPSLEAFTVVADDGTDTGEAELSLGIQLPPAPRNVVGVPDDGEVAVSWDEPGDTTGITGYEVTAAPGGATCSTVGVSNTSCDVTGLTNGTAYTFTVTPTTDSGPGTTSLPSDPVTPTGPPDAPVSVEGAAGDGRVVVSWDPPANDGGSPITGYTVSSSPGDGSCTTTGATDCTVLGLAIGTTYTFTVHATNANGDSAESDPVVVTIKAVTSVALESSDASVDEGDSVTLTATIDGSSPTGTVEFFDGVTSLGSAAVSGGEATLVTPALDGGVHEFTAVYSGDDDNASSTSPIESVTAVAAATATIAASPASPGEGETVTFTVTIDGASPTGTVEFFDGVTSLGTATVDGTGVATLATSALSLGGHTISAVYSGDATNSGATTDDLALTVRTVASVVVAADPATVVTGETVTLTATVAGSAPTGTVEFFGGDDSLGTAALTDGVATLVVDAPAPGEHSVTAVYSGDGANTGATDEITVRALAAAEIDIDVSKSTVVAGDPITITASITGQAPTGVVEFFDGETSLGTAAVVAGVATLVVDSLEPGTYVLTARYSGDDDNTTATSDEAAVVVLPAPSAEVDNPDPEQGEPVTVTGENFMPGTDVEIWVVTEDGPVLLATVPADAEGNVTSLASLPEELTGEVTIELRGTDQAGDEAVQVLGVTIRPSLAITGGSAWLFTLGALIAVAGGAALVLMVKLADRRRSLHV